MASPVARLFPLRPLLRKPRALLFAPYTPTVLRFIRFASAAGIKVDCAVPYDVSNMTYVLIKAYGGKPVYFPSAPWKLPLQLSKLTALDPNSPSSEYFQPQPYEFLPGLRDNLFRLFNLLKSTDGVIWWRVSRRDWHNNPKWTLKLENAEPLLFQYCTQSDFRWYIEEMGIRPVIETINFIDSMTPYRAPKVLTCSLRPAGVPKPNSTVSLSKLRWSKWTSIHGAFSDKALFPTSRQQSDVEEELKFDRTGESVAPLSPPTGGSLDVDLFLRTIVELVFSGFKSFHEIDLDDMPCPQTDSPRDIQKTVLAYFQRHHGDLGGLDPTIPEKNPLEVSYFRDRYGDRIEKPTAKELQELVLAHYKRRHNALPGPDPLKSWERFTSPRNRNKDGESIENAKTSSKEADERLPKGEAEPEKKARRDQTNRARLPSRSEKGETPSSRQESQLSDALRRWLPLPKSGERKTGDSNSKPAEKVKRRKATSYIAPAQPKTAFE